MPRAKLLAFAKLLRLPNLFTAVADPLAGWLITGSCGAVLLPVGSSACLYTAGIVLNDCFDYRLDCRERPERPLPRGDIPVSMAWLIGAILFLAGLALGGSKALPLAALIIFYNAVAKKSVWLAPVTLGACRVCNFALGMGGFVPRWPLVILGVYVAGLTLLARREVLQPALRRVVKQMLLGIIVVDAICVAVTGDWLGAMLVLSLLVPATVLGKTIPMT
ncbi:MAG: UbiA family prenyltransferase [Verrucomicrobiota bacterium]